MVPSNGYTMEQEGEKQIKITGMSDKQQITAVFCGSPLGDFLPIQMIYKDKTARCDSHFKFLIDCDITSSPKHWSTEQTMLQYMDNIIAPYVATVREKYWVTIKLLWWLWTTLKARLLIQ